MYTNYWNLSEEPFQNNVDGRFAFMAEQVQEGLARLLYLVEGRKLGGALAGPYGVGKSMMLEMLADKIRQRSRSYMIRVDAPVGKQVITLANRILQRLEYNGTVSGVADALRAFEEICREENGLKAHVVICIDEAQLLRDTETMYFLHLLTNLRTLMKDGLWGRNAITLILSGHSEMLQIIAFDGALAQRLQLVYTLKPLNIKQLTEYVAFRVRAAGGDPWLFDQDVFPYLYEACRGLPRVANNICDVALILGCSANVKKIDATIMRQAIDEVNLPLMAALVKE